jgi:hypothetical protein
MSRTRDARRESPFIRDEFLDAKEDAESTDVEARGALLVP